MEVWTTSQDQRSATVTGRVRVSIWKKLQPWWWFGNEAEFSQVADFGH